MKIRTSFVTNSSSSSFLIQGTKNSSFSDFIAEKLLSKSDNVKSLLSKLIENAIYDGYGDTYCKTIDTKESWVKYILGRYDNGLDTKWAFRRLITGEDLPKNMKPLSQEEIKELEQKADKAREYSIYLMNPDNCIHCEATYNDRLLKYIELLKSCNNDYYLGSYIEEIEHTRDSLASWNENIVYYKGEIDYEDHMLNEIFEIAGLKKDN